MTVATATKTKSVVSIFADAKKAGAAAAAACTPRPMVVGTPKNLLGSLMGGDDGGFDSEQPIYHVAGGVCGFAWVKISPARGKLVTYLKKKGIGRRDTYSGGYSISSNDIYRPAGALIQSLEIAEATCRAAAESLRSDGINAYCESRMD